MCRIARVLEARPKVLDGYVFGSSARGDAQPHSDVDVAVHLDVPGSSPRNFGPAAELTAELMHALGTNRVDVAILIDASPLLYHRVLRDGVRVVSRDLAASATREGQALSRYCDYVPQLAMVDAARRTVRAPSRAFVTRGALDPLVVRRDLGAIRDALTALRRHVGLTSAELRTDTELRWAIERGLQLCAQNALDVATHLVAAAGREAPDYAISIDCLAEMAILPREFADRFRGVAGFRNVLVHGYLEVDLGLLQQTLAERLDDFERFTSLVEEHLERAPR